MNAASNNIAGLHELAVDRGLDMEAVRVHLPQQPGHGAV